MQRVYFMTRQGRCILHYVNVRINKSSLCWETILRVKKKKRVFFCLFYQDHVINLHPPNNCPNSTLILLFNLAAPAAPSLLSSPGNVFSKADTAPISHSRSLSSGGWYYLDVSAWITLVIHKYYANESASCLRE